MTATDWREELREKAITAMAVYFGQISSTQEMLEASNQFEIVIDQTIDAILAKVAEKIQEMADGPYGQAIYSWTPSDYVKFLASLTPNSEVK